MDDAGNTKDDLKLPTDDELAKEARARSPLPLPRTPRYCPCGALMRPPHAAAGAAADQVWLRRRQGACCDGAEGAARAQMMLFPHAHHCAPRGG
jgi:hypothetical protein